MQTRVHLRKFLRAEDGIHITEKESKTLGSLASWVWRIRGGTLRCINKFHQGQLQNTI
jgi:hypothetical protein